MESNESQQKVAEEATNEPVTSNATAAQTDASNVGSEGSKRLDTEQNEFATGAQKRIDKLTARLKAETERRIAAEKNIQANYAPVPIPNSGGMAAPLKPDRSQFADPYDYAEALLNFDKQKNAYEASQRQSQVNQEQMQRYKEDLNMQHTHRVNEFKKSVPDFDDTIAKIEKFIPQSHVIAIQKSGKSAEIAYYLGKNVDEALEFGQLDPMDAILKVGELTHELKSNRQSSATVPMAPLQSATTSAAKKASKVTELRKKYYGKRG